MDVSDSVRGKEDEATAELTDSRTAAMIRKRRAELGIDDVVRVIVRCNRTGLATILRK